jgi:hypothetical protein
MLALPEGALPLVVGTGLAVGALTLVLSPLISALDGSEQAAPVPSSGNDGDDRPVTAVDALREIEFDRATGKLSESDYAALKTRYTRDALAELRAAQPAAVAAPVSAEATSDLVQGPSNGDRVEAAIQRARAHVRECTVCGPRPETDATYCSSCGRYLPGACRSCGQSVDLVGARFCSGCGDQLSAA